MLKKYSETFKKYVDAAESTYTNADHIIKISDNLFNIEKYLCDFVDAYLNFQKPKRCIFYCSTFVGPIERKKKVFQEFRAICKEKGLPYDIPLQCDNTEDREYQILLRVDLLTK